LRWRAGEVAAFRLRTTRAAELVTLLFARRSVEIGLGIYPVVDFAQARKLLDAS
jgi:hypothetical protein